MVKFSYKYLMDAGFRRHESEDSIFFNEFGYNYFIVSKEINDHVMIEWDIHTQQLELTLYDNDVPLRKTKIQTLDEFKLMMIMCKDILNIKSLQE